MRYLLVALVLALSSVSVVPAAFSQQAADSTIGMVDLQRALNTVEDGRNARTRLEEEFERRRTELATQREAVETFAAELEASMPMLTQEAAMERYEEYQERVLALQQALAENETAMAEAESNATGEIFERMVVLVSEIAEERGFTVVVEKSTIVFAAPGLEFTDDLIALYNERY
jgi:outer membrane protein